MKNIEKIEEIVNKGCEMEGGEEALRIKVISRLLEYLGWNLDDDVEINKSFPTGTSGSVIPDYVLSNEKAKMVLEAKAAGTDLMDYTKQTISYILQSRSEFGVIYNGKGLLVLHKDNNEPIYEWKCGQSKEIFTTLTRANYPEMLESLVKSESQRHKLDSYIKENSELLRKDMVKAISSGTGTAEDVISELVKVDVSLIPPNADMEEPFQQNNDAGNAEVVVCSTYSDNECGGLKFIEKTGGYGFVQLRKSRHPKYLAIYEPEEEAITAVYKINDIKRGDMSISQNWRGCKDILQKEDDYRKGKKVFFVLGEKIKEFKRIDKSHGFFIPGIRFIPSLDALLRAKETKDVLPRN